MSDSRVHMAWNTSAYSLTLCNRREVTRMTWRVGDVPTCLACQEALRHMPIPWVNDWEHLKFAYAYLYGGSEL